MSVQVFAASACGAPFVDGAAAVDPLPEVDHGPSPFAFAARTCTRYAEFACSARIVSVNTVRIESGCERPGAPSVTQSDSEFGSFESLK
ncbi:MAG: hypothetical protein OXN85_00040 [Gemmatimonadetes bacterium]|nr:hypothetical protein [Candidatus Palauibacter australiensis]